MGHYLSEMESPAEAAVREEYIQRILSLANRGYSGTFGSKSVTGKELMYHQLCGGAVFDPELHDSLCPVMRTTAASLRSKKTRKAGKKKGKSQR